MNRLIVAFGFALATFAPSAFAAGDPLEVGPEIYKLLFENERVRVMEVTFKPGAKIAVHSHPDHSVYVVTGGTLRIAPEGAKASDAALDHGSVVFIPAEAHAAENVGPTTMKLIVTELKDPPAKKN